MARSHLSVTTLEEHEPNPDFVGRNFNAGEVVQLVLRAPGGPGAGRWLSFRSVQMVMAHELAHCVQMNHGGEFWKVRDRFAGELRGLWERGYTGDGLWGRGRTLLSGEYHTGGRTEDEVLPARVCGGTFRSRRGGKRKRGGAGGGERRKETYAERQQRRIKRKFGVNGVALGGDEETKVKLEKGKKAKGKPRVAGSLRGRELRAAAALARFEEKKEEDGEEEELKGEERMLSGSETESDYEDTEAVGEAFDVDGSRMRDGKGRGMVKVCEDEDQDDVHVKQEIEELQGLDDVGTDSRPTAARDPTTVDPTKPCRAERAGTDLSQVSTSKYRVPTDRVRMEDIPQYVENDDRQSAKNTKAVKINIRPLLSAKNETPNGTASRTSSPPVPAPPRISDSLETICPICSMSNDPGSLLCIACSHVLDTSKITKHWRCRTDACQGSQYINAADCGRCGICGARKDGDEF